MSCEIVGSIPFSRNCLYIFWHQLWDSLTNLKQCNLASGCRNFVHLLFSLPLTRFQNYHLYWVMQKLNYPITLNGPQSNLFKFWIYSVDWIERQNKISSMVHFFILAHSKQIASATSAILYSSVDILFRINLLSGYLFLLKHLHRKTINCAKSLKGLPFGHWIF